MLDSDSVFVFDGAMGTRLYDKGIYINRSYDELNIAAPDLVESRCVRIADNMATAWRSMVSIATGSPDSG